MAVLRTLDLILKSLKYISRMVKLKTLLISSFFKFREHRTFIDTTLGNFSGKM